jgi:Domain of unknown function (DUF3859)
MLILSSVYGFVGMPDIVPATPRGNLTMRPILAFLFLGFATSASRAQNITIDRVDIVESGIYKIHRTGKIVQSPNTATGTLRPATDGQLLKATTTIPAKAGTSFGVRFKVMGKPIGAKTKITLITQYPAQGLRNPDTGKTAQLSEFELGIEIGKRDGRTYTFDTGWEAVPGEWALEFCYEGRKVGGQTFTVVK